ncbi:MULTISPECIES: CYTH and CHAD domain-containing protein [Nitrosomonas]|uniref:Inorganic triphosphatase YgiF n=1 Tax=Nitrosomonas communis TaxID=44574 RepID=A0A5D3YE66_9PROT|nr:MULTISPECIES: CYTH and CHAD domain-containing protein [Nitrosomonas]TYP90100.1 inorganic triphosphatase YgiF [Nitrosomonas communis]UVS60362.1 CYTH and CHAD domain-containing protein [Nitrosomonas sp. PLL12]
MPKEIELKLSLPRSCIKHLQHLPLLETLGISRPTKQKLYTIYFDTPDLALKRQNCALRLRQMGKNWLQTIKTEGSVASGLHERNEWEVSVPSNQLDFTQLGDPGMIKLLSDAELRKQLRQVFITRFTRHMYLLQMEEGSQIEFCFDHGKIIIDHTKESFTEIELELKSGKPKQLFRLALTLVQILPFPLRLENISKAERGYMLYTGHKNPPVKALPVELKADMDLTTAFTLIAQNCLDQLTRNEHGVITRIDVEYLHQMRIALRRLRTAFDVFASAIPNEVSLIHELKWLTNQLNPARDWDVFVTEQLPKIQQNFEDHTGIAALIKTCEILRKKHNKAARNSIKSKRYTKLILQLNLYLEEAFKYPGQPKTLKKAVTNMALINFTKSVLINCHKHIIDTTNKVEEFDLTSLHSLRISIKKQRYAVEFFQALFAPVEVKKYIQSLSGLQDILGSINDSINTQRLLKQIPGSKTKTLVSREATGIILGWNKQRLQRMNTEIKDALQLFYHAPLFWEAR